MNKIKIMAIYILLTFVSLTIACETRDGEGDYQNSVLIVVFDGLRPDYITPEWMPNLYKFGERGVVGELHHSTFPTVTSVNSASIVTGTTPEGHGILHNTIFIPEVSEQSFSPGNQEMLQKIYDSTGSHLLTAKSLGEVMEKEGKKLWITGSSGLGTLMRLNHKLTGFGVAGARGFVEPESMKERITDIMNGFVDRQDSDRNSLHRGAFSAFLKVGLDELKPDATIMWISDPDGTSHQTGVGSPQTLEAISDVDELFGQMINGIRERGMEERINIFVTTDHGFSTLTNELEPEAAVAAAGIDPEKYHVVTNRPKVYVKESDPDVIRQIVKTLQEDETVGAIFTRSKEAGVPDGAVPGTLSLSVVDYDHERSPDILFDATWNDLENEYGFAGHTTNTRYPANHGTSSPYDINIPLIAGGPDIKQGLNLQVPTGNIDLAPTVCHLLGIEPPHSMQGRILHELLRNGPDPRSIPFEDQTFTTDVYLNESGIKYHAEVRKYLVGQTEYLHLTKAERIINSEQ